MCDPVSAGLTILSTGLGIAGQAQQANAQAAGATYQAQVASNNAAVQEWNARNAEKVGLVAEDQQRQKTALAIGAERAALAAQGGDVNSGSPVDIMSDTARAGIFDALTLRSNAMRQAWSFRVAGANANTQAGLADASAANAMASLPFSIGKSLLGGASSLMGQWSPGLGSSAGSPIGAGATMAAYNAAPSWFTRPGL